MARTRWSLRLAAAAVAALTVSALVACSDAKSGQEGPNPENPWQIAGATTSTGPSGPRDGVPDTDRAASNSDGGEIDTLALNAIADIEEFWSENYSASFPGEFEPVSELISWDAEATRRDSVEFCTTSTYELVNAAYCGLDTSIGWDRGVLLPTLVEKFGEMAVVMVLAHEYGHALQVPAGIATEDTPDLVTEQQADCLAGVFLRHVAEDNSPHFTLNTGEGLNGLLGATVAVRDRDPNDPDNVHGSAFERVTAVQMGYMNGTEACSGIDEREIEERRSGLLSDGLAASDVNGDRVPEGYLRLDAFRKGVLDGEQACLTEYA